MEDYNNSYDKERDKLYNKNGRTQYQMTNSLYDMLYSWRIRYKIQYDTPFNTFYTMWPFLDTVLYNMKKDLEFIKKIESS